MHEETISNRILGGFTGRIAGSTLGLPVEGKKFEFIREHYGEIIDYVDITRDSTGNFYGLINDDEIYEIILLLALEQKGKSISTKDIANEWLKRLEGFNYVFTAERVALQRFREGTFLFGADLIDGNPFHDYIGAQMRGEMPGWVFPGSMDDSAWLARIDAETSHAGDGVTGEIFISVLVSQGFTIPEYQVEKGKVDPAALESIINNSINLLPNNGRYREILSRVIELHHDNPDHYQSNFLKFREYFEGELFDELYENSDEGRKKELLKSYGVHVLPNAGIILLALLHGGGRFTDSLKICVGCGLDTDCNCGNVGAILGTILGFDNIPDNWKKPLNNTFLTWVKGWEEDEIDVIANRIFDLSKKLC